MGEWAEQCFQTLTLTRTGLSPLVMEHPLLSLCCYGKPKALKTTNNEIQVPLESLKDRRGALRAG